MLTALRMLGRGPALAVASLAAVGLILGVAPVLVPASAALPPGTAGEVERARPVKLHDAHGVKVVSAESIGARELRVVVRTKQLARDVRVDILLPRGYSRASRRFPVLHLFHGTSGGAHDWTEMGEAKQATAGLPLIVVMPDAGYDSNGGSWFTNWVDQLTPLGKANWETFHVDQLVPWIDANLRTRPNRNARAIAGVSQGGFGSFSYAARHPDTFLAAASFSGAPDIAKDPLAKSLGSVVVSAIMTGQNGVQPYAPFGDPIVDDIIWQGHNPASLVTNLAHSDLRLWAGNGSPGPLDPPAPNPAGNGIEAITYASTLAFTRAADAARVGFELTDYGAGTHTWPYWARDLRQYLPKLVNVLGQRRALPAVIGYASIEKRWSQWGWRVVNKRAEKHAWSELQSASRKGFRFVGGQARVITPAIFKAGRTYTVTYQGATGPSEVRAGRHGRLRLLVRNDSAQGPAVVELRRKRVG